MKDTVNEQKNDRLPGVLIVDGDEVMRRGLDEGLQLAGFAVWTAADSQRALKVFKQHRDEIDLVLLEVQLADGSGLETLAALRRINPEIRSCFMSARVNGRTEEELRQQGGVAIIDKPFTPAEVARLLWRRLRPPFREPRLFGRLRHTVELKSSDD